MEAGWVVTEVGRQPWIVYKYMKVEDAATGNTGVWITFVAVVLLYLTVAVATVLVLRSMSRRFRRADEAVDQMGPDGPSVLSARAGAGGRDGRGTP
jgi:cytochrome d ubiquinol oxidase subunit I